MWLLQVTRLTAGDRQRTFIYILVSYALHNFHIFLLKRQPFVVVVSAFLYKELRLGEVKELFKIMESGKNGESQHSNLTLSISPFCLDTILSISLRYMFLPNMNRETLVVLTKNMEHRNSLRRQMYHQQTLSSLLDLSYKIMPREGLNL